MTSTTTHTAGAASLQPENPYCALVRNQRILTVPSFVLECGITLRDVPVAYKTFGTLSESRDNVMFICHALTGSADVSDWWGPLLGPGRAFDTSRFFVVCCNVLGSPYGTASPVTVNPETGELYGPGFPVVTVRDSVRLHKIVLDELKVKQVAVCLGGSMGGMQVLEWALEYPDFVRCIVPIATSSRHSAWGISWGEAQRQAIFSDVTFQGGNYCYTGTDDAEAASDDSSPREASAVTVKLSEEESYQFKQPFHGLAAARMSALLTYRSRDSFESRFGRNIQQLLGRASILSSSSGTTMTAGTISPTASTSGRRRSRASPSGSEPHSPTVSNHTVAPFLSTFEASTAAAAAPTSASASAATASLPTPSPTPAPPTASGQKTPSLFTAQSYLRYQGEKFVNRFDANCYIAITLMMDTHDIARPRHLPADALASYKPSTDAIHATLRSIKQPSLVIGIGSDGLFTIDEQREIATHIPDSQLEEIQSPDGHDGFLLEFETLDRLIKDFLKRKLPEFMTETSHGLTIDVDAAAAAAAQELEEDHGPSLGGEIGDADILQW
ncbi:homoserine O-acetyltransferase [Ramicandelaber brevisporus]|nr:homoserine O-acetyltransferase [Ramicandelaber brevisporus]